VAEKKPNSLPIVLVDWIDADTATDGWQGREKVAAAEIKIVHSAGFLLSSDTERLVVVTDYDPSDDNANGGSVIPRGMVKKIIRLGVWKAK
jgi:hypothetical protein